MQLRRPQAFPLLFMVATTALLVGLGVWQVQRLQWKNGVLAGIAQAQQAPILTQLPNDIHDLRYRNVALSGVLLNDQSFRFVGRKEEAGSDVGMGFFVVTPLTLADGRVVLVNRGWSPEGRESRPEGVQTIHGILRPLREKRLFSPGNRPDKNIWFIEDLPAMAARIGSVPLPMVVEAVGVKEKNTYPIPGDGKISLRNDHLGYAITWFALALIGVVMFIIYLREPMPTVKEPVHVP